MINFLKIGIHLINLEQIAGVNLDDRVNGSMELSAPSSVAIRFAGAHQPNILRFTGDEAEAIREYFSIAKTRCSSLINVNDITPVATTTKYP